MTKKTRALISNTQTAAFLKKSMVETVALPEKLGGSLAESAFADDVANAYQMYLHSKETFKL